MGTDFWSLETEFSFLHTVAVKVADPLIFGDFLKVLRPVDRNNVDQVDRYASKVADVVTVLTKGLRQSQRYSKTLAVRMVEGVSQIAVGAGVDLKPHVPVLAKTLLDVQAISSGVRSATAVALTRLYCIAPFDVHAALNEIIRSHLIDNSMDSLARQIRRVYAKLREKEKSFLALLSIEGDVDEAALDAKMAATRARWAPTLRELMEKSCMELHKQRIELTACIDIIEKEQKCGRLKERENKRHSLSDAQSTSVSLEVGSQVAARVARGHELWILASVVKADDRMVEVEDEDSGDEETEGKRHHSTNASWRCIPARLASILRSSLCPIHRYAHPLDFVRFAHMHAMLFMQGCLYVIVRFDDDADEVGTISEYKIPFRFVMPLKKT
ncbi:hypothetical protein DYB32_002274 [Aphanomyces invadans]|uniref:Uncharacterized protein n=1 Tax=Aphanomyces invadans TaxID=157072 RepID=A0A418B3S0_9STRA|nr:hypothetical protein DYB32_002274 [Aphanomyces invadans]